MSETTKAIFEDFRRRVESVLPTKDPDQLDKSFVFLNMISTEAKERIKTVYNNLIASVPEAVKIRTELESKQGYLEYQDRIDELIRQKHVQLTAKEEDKEETDHLHLTITRAKQSNMGPWYYTFTVNNVLKDEGYAKTQAKAFSEAKKAWESYLKETN